jgi:hypothetical protein
MAAGTATSAAITIKTIRRAKSAMGVSTPSAKAESFSRSPYPKVVNQFFIQPFWATSGPPTIPVFTPL